MRRIPSSTIKPVVCALVPVKPPISTNDAILQAAVQKVASQLSSTTCPAAPIGSHGESYSLPIDPPILLRLDQTALTKLKKLLQFVPDEVKQG